MTRRDEIKARVAALAMLDDPAFCDWHNGREEWSGCAGAPNRLCESCGRWWWNPPDGEWSVPPRSYVTPAYSTTPRADFDDHAPADLEFLLDALSEANATIERIGEQTKQNDGTYIECVECFRWSTGEWQRCHWHDGFDEANDRVRAILEGNGA